jgi:iron complex transport system substrate-binding protein
MKRFSLSLLTLLTGLMVFTSACGGTAPVEIEDSAGNIIVFEEPPQRIVSLAPSTTEILFAVGAGDQVVGREDYANYPEEAFSVTSVGDTYAGLNIEAILALEPDLVVVAPLTSPEQILSLEDVGLQVFVVPNPTSIPEMYDTLRLVARVTGHEEETESLIESLENRVAAVLELVEEADTTPLVFYQLDSTEPAAPWTSGPGTFIDSLISMAGGKNVAGGLEGAWVQISAEELIAQNPEVIMVGDAIWGITPEMVAERPGWDMINAVVNGRVHPFNDDLASRPGPRLVDGLEEMARLIHPELFE